MAEFEIAVAQVLKREGGFVDHPADLGGPTKYGISSRSYPHLSIEALTESQAKLLYKKDFLGELFDRIPSQKIADKLFDCCVHLGKSAGVLLLQEALGEVRMGVTVDGIFGPQTLQAVRLACQSKAQLLLDAMRYRQAKHYVTRVLAQPSQQVFLDGWLRRVVI